MPARALWFLLSRLGVAVGVGALVGLLLGRSRKTAEDAEP